MGALCWLITDSPCMIRPQRRRSSGSKSPCASPMPEPRSQNVGPAKDLRHAAMYGDIEALQGFVSTGSEVDAKGCFGWTALHLSVKYQQEESVQCLINEKADVNIKDDKGRTALDWAERKKHKEIKKLLSANGAVTAAPTDTVDVNQSSCLCTLQ